MKQFLLKGMATRLFGLMVAFLMAASQEGEAQTTHSVSSTDEWNNVVSSLQANDIIQLTADVTMENVPDKVCIITSDDGTKTLTYSSDLQMAAPLTFKSIKLNMSCIYANGYALVFDEGVDCVGTYGAGVTGLSNIWGGSETGSVASTSVVLKSGTFGWVYAGGNRGAVEGKAKMELSGSVKMNGTVFGGGDATSATCGSTHIEISGGTYKDINGGGYNGSVTGECYLKISGDPTIVGNVFGGSNQKGTTVGSTRVQISGGTFRTENNDGPGSIYAGGWECVVTGNTSIVVTGGEMGHIFGGCGLGQVGGNASMVIDGANIKTELNNGAYTGGSIYGGGYGEWGVDSDKGKVGSTTVQVIKLGEKSTDKLDVFGGGFVANIVGSTNVIVEDGNIFAVYGTGYIDSNNSTTVGGDVNVTISGGTIKNLSAIRASDKNGKVPVAGSLNLIIKGGTLTSTINPGFDFSNKNAEYKDCTLIIRNLGTEMAPYSLPQVSGINTVRLENSTVNMMDKPISQYSGWQIKNGHPLIIEGNGKLIGKNIQLARFGPDDFAENEPLVIADNLPAETTFVTFKAPDTTSPVYKAGNTYRPAGNKVDQLKVITITPTSRGKLSVLWKEVGRETELETGDQVPVNTELTLSLAVNSGYQGGNIYVDNQPLSGSTYTVTDDVTISAGDITKIPDPEPAPEPVPPVYYTVTLPQVEGAVTDPAAGNYEVEAWDSFRFYLTLDKEYDQSEPVVTTDRNETIQPRTSDGAYIIKYVRQPIVIKIDGVVKNPGAVANETVDTNGIKIYAANGYLHIQTPQPEQIHIFTPDGRLLKAFRTSGNEERIALPKGIYLIRTANQAVKVVL